MWWGWPYEHGSGLYCRHLVYVRNLIHLLLDAWHLSGFLVLLCLLGAVAKPPLMKPGGNHVQPCRQDHVGSTCTHSQELHSVSDLQIAPLDGDRRLQNRLRTKEGGQLWARAPKNPGQRHDARRLDGPGGQANVGQAWPRCGTAAWAGPNSAEDLQIMKALGADTALRWQGAQLAVVEVRLYGNNPQESHVGFLDEAYRVGLKVVPGMSYLAASGGRCRVLEVTSPTSR